MCKFEHPPHKSFLRLPFPSRKYRKTWIRTSKDKPNPMKCGQLKPKRDKERVLWGDLSLPQQLKGCISFFPFARNNFLRDGFLDARHVRTLSRSLSIGKQTLFRDGRDSKAPCQKTTSNAGDSKQLRKLAAGERDLNQRRVEGKGKKQEKRLHVLFRQSRVSVRACWRVLVKTNAARPCASLGEGHSLPCF